MFYKTVQLLSLLYLPNDGIRIDNSCRALGTALTPYTCVVGIVIRALDLQIDLFPLYMSSWTLWLAELKIFHCNPPSVFFSDRCPKTSAPCENRGYRGSKCRCICPRHLIGETCQRVQTDNGKREAVARWWVNCEFNELFRCDRVHWWHLESLHMRASGLQWLIPKHTANSLDKLSIVVSH